MNLFFIWRMLTYLALLPPSIFRSVGAGTSGKVIVVSFCTIYLFFFTIYSFKSGFVGMVTIYSFISTLVGSEESWEGCSASISFCCLVLELLPSSTSETFLSNSSTDSSLCKRTYWRHWVGNSMRFRSFGSDLIALILLIVGSCDCC